MSQFSNKLRKKSGEQRKKMLSPIVHQPIIHKFNTSGVNDTFENWNCLSIFKKVLLYCFY